MDQFRGAERVEVMEGKKDVMIRKSKKEWEKKVKIMVEEKKGGKKSSGC